MMRNVAALSPGPKGGTKPVSSLTQEQAKAVLAAVEGWRLEAACGPDDDGRPPYR